MNPKKPSSLWDDVRAAIRGWIGGSGDDDEEGEQAQDPGLLFHALFTAPMVIMLIALGRRGLGL
jgi:hypothetical protein